jgi:hypothetical protein
MSPLYVRSLSQVLGMLAATATQVALNAVPRVRRPRP